MNYFECTALCGTPLTLCGNKAVQWYAMYASDKHLSRPKSLAKVLRRCQQHKINGDPHPILLGRFLTEEEVTVLSIMEDNPEKIFKEEDNNA